MVTLADNSLHESGQTGKVEAPAAMVTFIYFVVWLSLIHFASTWVSVHTGDEADNMTRPSADDEKIARIWSTEKSNVCCSSKY